MTFLRMKQPYPKLGGWGGKTSLREDGCTRQPYQGGQEGSSAQSIFNLIVTSYLTLTINQVISTIYLFLQERNHA